MRKKRNISLPAFIYSALIFIFLYAPIVVLIIYSFNSSKSRGTWGGFSLKWYKELFNNSTIMSALTTTLTIAVISSIIAVIIGTAAAVGIFYCRKRTKTLLTNIAYVPMLNADIVTGISLLLLFTFIGVKLGYMSILLAQIGRAACRERV